ncbi:MAG: hypothetical protein AAGG68_08280 [Bacteroidota bacterium]
MMNDHPYRKEIVGVITLGTILLFIETWRRWNDLWSYTYFEDVILVALGFVAAYYLWQRTYTGQLLWIFTCGYAMCSMTDSFVSALTRINEVDASGFPTTQVIVLKAVMYGLVILMTRRAFILMRKYQFE